MFFLKPVHNALNFIKRPLTVAGGAAPNHNAVTTVLDYWKDVSVIKPFIDRTSYITHTVILKLIKFRFISTYYLLSLVFCLVYMSFRNVLFGWCVFFSIIKVLPGLLPYNLPWISSPIMALEHTCTPRVSEIRARILVQLKKGLFLSLFKICSSWNELLFLGFLTSSFWSNPQF